MKKLIPLSLMCLLLLGVSQQTQAQTAEDPWGVTVRTGLTGFNGDLGNSLLNFEEGKIAYGVGLSYYLSNGFDIALNATAANLAKANSATDPVFSQRGTSFEANVVSLDLLLRWKFVNTFATNDSKFSPYLAAGLGVNGINFEEGTGPGGVPLTPQDRSSWEFSVPFGAGMNVELSDNLQLNVQAIYNRSFTDEIDQVTGIDDVDHDDWLTSTVGLTVVFGGPEKKEMKNARHEEMMESLGNIESDVDDINNKMDRLIELNEESLEALEQLQEDLKMSDNQMEEVRAKFVRIINNIQFAFDESYIIEPAQDELESLVDVMQEYQNLGIHLEAYADRRGSTEYNQELAAARAQSVKDFLTSRGVSASRISTEVYGETEEVLSSSTEADQATVWAQNRAVQITLSYNGM